MINVELQLLLTDTEILDRNETCAPDYCLTGAGDCTKVYLCFRLDGREFADPFLAGVENYVSSTTSKVALVSMSLSIQAWPLNPRVKLPGGENDYCPQSRTEIENVCSSASTSSYISLREGI